MNKNKPARNKSFRIFYFSSLLLVIAFAFGCSFSGEKKEENKQDIAAQEFSKTVIPVEGMTCNACAASIKNKLKSIEGIGEVKVSLENRNATVLYEENAVTPEQIKEAINEIGFKAGIPVTEKRNE